MEADTRYSEIRGFHLPTQWNRGSEDCEAKFQIDIVLRITPFTLIIPPHRVISIVKLPDVGGLQTPEDSSTSVKS